MLYLNLIIYIIPENPLIFLFLLDISVNGSTAVYEANSDSERDSMLQYAEL